MSFLKAIEVLEQLEDFGTKRKEKENLLKENADNIVLKSFFVLTYDWMITYGITTPVIKEKYRGADLPLHFLEPRENIYSGFITLLHAYSKRQLTGNLAKEAWHTFISQCNAREAFWFNRVLNRDLKIGIAETTVAKVWKGALSEFACQLAPTEGYEPGQELKFPVLVEPKYDGVRVLTVVKGSKATIHSRNGKELPGLQHFADAIAQSVPGEYVVDGEVFHDSWNSTIKLSKTYAENLTAEEKKLREGLKYFVFDTISLGDFKQGFSLVPLYSRLTKLAGIVEKVNIDHQDDPIFIEQTPAQIANSHEEILAIYDKAIDEGFEGCMIKDGNAGYKFGRTKAWLKWKPWKTEDGVIIGFEEGKDGGKFEGTLGAFVVRMESGETTRVGGKMSDKLRDDFWADQKNLLGKTIEFKRQEDLNQVAVSRFPQFLRFRDDK